MTSRPKLLVTGAHGMVGRNLVTHPAAEAWEVLAPSRAELDLADWGATRAWFLAHRPDAVVHAAGRVGGIQANIAAPVDFLVTNLDLGRNVVLAAREAGVRRLLNLGSSCMYPRAAPNPLTEERILTGELEPTNEGYALAKIMTARLCDYVRREDPACQYKTLVPSNLYGRFDHFDPATSHLVPAILRKLHAAKQAGQDEVEVWGDGTARREFMYAGDLAEVVFRALERFETVPDVMNVGLGHDYAVNEYYLAGAEVVGWRGRLRHDLTKPTGMQQKLVSVARLAAWGWRSTTSLHDGLRATYAHYLEGRP